MGQSTWLATSIPPYRGAGVESMAAARDRHGEPAARLGMWRLALQLLMQILPTQRRDKESQADGNRDKHGRRHVRVMQPPYFMEALKNISGKPAEIVRNHDHR